MNRISDITKKDVVAALVNGFDEDVGFGIFQHYNYSFWGVLNPVEFLNRLYCLKHLPSFDSRYKNAEEDITMHTVIHPEDYPEGWVFDDDRFHLKTCSDDDFLNFICEIFHPAVRNEKENWNALYAHLNSLLSADGYELYIKGQISKRNVYGWRDKTIPRFQSLKEQDIKCFISLLVRQGNVIDFYHKEDFDDFTQEAIGIRLCERYGTSASKGSALRQFLADCMDEELLIKLLSALIKRYEDSSMYSTDDKRFVALYNRCRAVLNNANKTNKSALVTVKGLKQAFSNQYLNSQMDLMLKMQEENPTEAIGKAKELVESCCKTILEFKAVDIDKKWDLGKLVSETMKLLRITPDDIPENILMATQMKKLLGNLRAIAEALSELRNAYGSGHGKSATYKGLQPRHAKLAVGSSSTLVQFLWDSFQRQNKNSPVEMGNE